MGLVCIQRHVLASPLFHPSQLRPRRTCSLFTNNPFARVSSGLSEDNVSWLLTQLQRVVTWHIMHVHVSPPCSFFLGLTQDPIHERLIHKTHNHGLFTRGNERGIPLNLKHARTLFAPSCACDYVLEEVTARCGGIRQRVAPAATGPGCHGAGVWICGAVFAVDSC